MSKAGIVALGAVFVGAAMAYGAKEAGTGRLAADFMENSVPLTMYVTDNENRREYEERLERVLNRVIDELEIEGVFTNKPPFNNDKYNFSIVSLPFGSDYSAVRSFYDREYMTFFVDSSLSEEEMFDTLKIQMQHLIGDNILVTSFDSSKSCTIADGKRDIGYVEESVDPASLLGKEVTSEKRSCDSYYPQYSINIAIPVK
jgi:hypothetical protein